MLDVTLECRFNKTTHHPSQRSPDPWEEEEEEEEEEFIISGNWRGKHNSLSCDTGADPS